MAGVVDRVADKVDRIGCLLLTKSVNSASSVVFLAGHARSHRFPAFYKDSSTLCFKVVPRLENEKAQGRKVALRSRT